MDRLFGPGTRMPPFHTVALCRSRNHGPVSVFQNDTGRIDSCDIAMVKNDN
jgi:hypothetical protein